MLRSSKTTVRIRSFWIITKHEENGPMEVLTTYSGGERILPVFSFEEEAEAFLGLETPGKGWRARQSMAGELASVLFGPCVGVKKVALDPLPAVIDGDKITGLVSMDRRRFVRDLVDDGCTSGFPSMDPEEIYVPDYVMWDFGCPNSGDSGDDELEAVWSPRESGFDL